MSNNNGTRSRQTVLFTDDLLTNMPITKWGGGYIWDSEAPLLHASRSEANNGVVKLSVIYSNGGAGRRLIKDGRAITRELLGNYPEISIERAREIAKERAAMFEEQKITPLAAPPLRKTNKRRERDVVPEAILKETKDVSPEDADRYEKLMGVLMDAYSQASTGKGDVRHSEGQAFDEQDMMQVMDRVGADSALGQVIKKVVEGRRLKGDDRRKEFLGAIVYLAGAIIWHDQDGKA